jgi:hypothetical protein
MTKSKMKKKTVKSCNNCLFNKGCHKHKLMNCVGFSSWKPIKKEKPDSKVKICLWQEDDDGNWETGCQEMFIFIEGGVKENGMIYCPYCGKKIKGK